ncbi:MAG: nucleotide exchange factor GrpE [Eubacteriales bacterium]|nr:nucleotide exchange factor GrpE [Eubacteriales bacterium]
MAKDNKDLKQKVDEMVETAENECKEKEQDEVAENTQKADGVAKDEMSPEEYVGYLETELGKNIALAEENKNTAQRLRADFENYKKRNESLASEMRAVGESAVLEKLLEVVDNVDRAKAMISDENNLKGFELIEQQLTTVLTKFNVKAMEVKTGDAFDPNLMTAVLREENAEMSGKVLDVLQKGYLKGETVLRYAMVKVAG